MKPLASRSGAAKALEARWNRTAETFGLMQQSVAIGRAIFKNKKRFTEAAEYERLVAGVEKLKVTFPRLWHRVIKEEPEPLSWAGGVGMHRLLGALKATRPQKAILISALAHLALSDLRKRSEAQLITVVVGCVLRAARKRGASGTELALLAIVTGFEQPTSDPHAQRQRPDTWDNCVKTCGPWIDWLMDPAPPDVRVFPDDIAEPLVDSTGSPKT